MSDFSVYFAYPGDLDTPTGGYRYDRRLIAELEKLRLNIKTLSLPPSALEPDQQSLKTIEQTFSEIPDQSVVCLLYTSPSPRDAHESRMPSSA